MKVQPPGAENTPGDTPTTKLVYNTGMGTEQVLERLREHRGRLAELGVVSLSVFGSVARGESRPDSDVDFLVEFDGPATFDRYTRLKFFLEDVFNRRIDLLTRQGVRAELRPFIEQDARRVA